MKNQYQKIKEQFRGIFSRDSIGFVPHNVIRSWFFTAVTGAVTVIILCGVGVYVFIFSGNEVVTPEATPGITTSFSQERLKKIVEHYREQEQYFMTLRDGVVQTQDVGDFEQTQDENEISEEVVEEEGDVPVPEM